MKLIAFYRVYKRAKEFGNPDYVPMFVDDEFDGSGEPNYIEAVNVELSNGGSEYASKYM